MNKAQPMMHIHYNNVIPCTRYTMLVPLVPLVRINEIL